METVDSRLRRRLGKELLGFYDLLGKAARPHFKLIDNGTHLSGLLTCPQGSPYDGHLIAFRLVLHGWPNQIELIFDPPLFHVNCQTSGRFDLGEYSPAVWLASLMIHVQNMLMEPEPRPECWTGVADMVALNELARDHPEEYRARARAHTIAHALSSTWSPATHAHFALRDREHVVFLLKVGLRLRARFPGGESAITDNWLARVLPCTIGPWRADHEGDTNLTRTNLSNLPCAWWGVEGIYLPVRSPD